MIDKNGISFNHGSAISWDEIVAVSVYKIDAIKKILTYIEFHHECGEYIEITNEDLEFQTIIDSLDNYLDLVKGWQHRIASMTADDDVIKLWVRE